MPEPLPEPTVHLKVSLPNADEERRAWAQVFCELHHVVSIVEKNPSYFIPGEHVGEFLEAAKSLKISLHRVAAGLDNVYYIADVPPPQPLSLPPVPENTVTVFPNDVLEKAQLNGATGVLKRSVLKWFYDRFLGYFRSQPTIQKNLQYAADAAARQADMGSVALDSLGAAADEVPFLALTCKGAEEGLLALKHLLGMPKAGQHPVQ